MHCLENEVTHLVIVSKRLRKNCNMDLTWRRLRGKFAHMQIGLRSVVQMEHVAIVPSPNLVADYGERRRLDVFFRYNVKSRLIAYLRKRKT